MTEDEKKLLALFERKQKEKDGAIIDDKEYDVIAINRDTRIVISITVWRKVNRSRADTLVQREQKGYSSNMIEVIAVPVGTAYIGKIIN